MADRYALRLASPSGFPASVAGLGSAPSSQQNLLTEGNAADMILGAVSSATPSGSFPGLPGTDLTTGQGDMTIFDMPITRTLPSILLADKEYGGYSEHLAGAWTWSLFAKRDGVSAQMTLTALNELLRQNWIEQKNARASARRRGVSNFADVGLGMKRKASSVVDAVNEDYLITTLERFNEHVQFLGVVNGLPTKDTFVANDRVTNNRLLGVCIQFSGIARHIPNVWGDVVPGDVLSFHVCHINNVGKTLYSNPSDAIKANNGLGIPTEETFQSWEDFGPLQIVPVVTRDGARVPHVIATPVQIFRGQMAEAARNPRNGTVPAEFGTDAYSPLFTRTGNTNQNLFDCVAPIRSITDGGKEITMTHWAPHETRISVVENGVKVERVLLNQKLQSNMVFHVGKVMAVHNGNNPPLSNEVRAKLLNEPSGKTLMRNNAYRLEIAMYPGL